MIVKPREIAPLVLLAFFPMLACERGNPSLDELDAALERTDGNYLGDSPREFAAVMEVRVERIEEVLERHRSEATHASEQAVEAIDDLRADIDRALVRLRTDASSSWRDLRDEVVRDVRDLELRVEALKEPEETS